MVHVSENGRVRAACFLGWPVVVGWPEERLAAMPARTSATRSAFAAFLAALSSSLEMALEGAPFWFCCFFAPVILYECFGSG